MAPQKSDTEVISLLVAIIEHADSIEWDKVAENTGLYKKGKFVKHAYNTIKAKYASADATAASSAATTTKASPKTPKKRTLKAEDAGSSSKKAKKDDKGSDDADDAT